MSTWTAATAAIRAKVEATVGDGGTAAIVPGYDEIPDGADIDRYADLFLRKGYAVEIADSSPIDLSVKTTNRVEERSYVVLLTREVNLVSTNTEGFVSLKSEMMEHSEALREAFDDDNTLGGVVIDIEWQGDTGIVELQDPQPDNPGPRYYNIGTEYLVKLQFR